MLGCCSYELGSYDLTVPLSAKKGNASQANGINFSHLQGEMTETQKQVIGFAKDKIGAAKSVGKSWLLKLVGDD